MGVDFGTPHVNMPMFPQSVKREGVIAALTAAGHGVALLVAPAGCGKSVAAEQFAVLGDFGVCLWVDCGLADIDETHYLQRETLRALGLSAGDQSIASALMPTTGSQDIEDALSRALTNLPSGSCCVVLDDVPDGFTVSAVNKFYELVRRTRQAEVSVVVTCRTEPTDLADGVLPNISLLDREHLRMSFEESGRLFRDSLKLEIDDHVVTSAWELSAGQPALLSVLSRHAATGGMNAVLDGRVPLDIKTLLQRSARSQLKKEHLDLLFVASLLRSGDISDLLAVDSSFSSSSLSRVAECVPLVHTDSETHSLRFRVHDIAASVFGSVAWAEKNVHDWFELTCATLEQLDASSRHGRLFEVALSLELGEEELVRWLLQRGDRLFDSGHTGLTSAALGRVGALAVVNEPRLLLLQARLLREQHQYDQALSKAKIAHDLAAHDEDLGLERESLLLTARLQIDRGLMGDAARSLEQAHGLVCRSKDLDSIVLTRAYLAACHAYIGDYARASSEMQEALPLIDSVISSEVRARVITCYAATRGLVGGMWNEAVPLLSKLADAPDLSFSMRLQMKGNLGTVLCDMGRMEDAERLLRRTLDECREHDLAMLELAFTGSLATVAAGYGNYSEANSLMQEAVEGYDSAGDLLELGHSLAYFSSWLRAQGNLQEGLIQAERVLQLSVVAECEWLKWLGLLELAACSLATGDIVGAERQAEIVHLRAASADAKCYLLCADMIIAECERRKGQMGHAIARVAAHADYISRENANYQIVMLIRTFPSLLAIMTQAISAAALPIHLIRMLRHSEPESLVGSCQSIMDEANWRVLAGRLLGKDRVDRIQRNQLECRVTLFGGLGVIVAGRRVTETDWRKAKARLLFAMLVLADGSEVPREKVLDYLWGDFDAEKALNNFYVIWSCIKAALSPAASKEEPCPYVWNKGRMCRVTDLVESDVREFEELLRCARDHERAESSTSAIRAYERLSEIYRGELLPGDVYEDWFTSARDRYRVEFGDAMLRAGRLLAEQGDPARAIGMLRKGLDADPHREDLYQAAMELQILCRQRSGAIETFMSCRKWLSEDLGLDPSAETMRLYEQVLAMDDAADYRTSSDSHAPRARREDPESGNSDPSDPVSE